MADIKMYEVLGYSREEKTEESKREGDVMVIVKTITTRQPVLRLRGVIVPCADDDGDSVEALVVSSDEKFLHSLRGVAFRNLSIGKDNRTYWLMADGSELDEDRGEGPEDAEWWDMSRVLGEVAE